MRGREAAPTATRPAVSSLCGPLAPGTPAPLDTEIGDTLGFTVGSTPFLPQKKKWAFCPASCPKRWEGAAAADATLMAAS